MMIPFGKFLSDHWKPNLLLIVECNARRCHRRHVEEYNLRMKIFMACPAPRHSRKGNRVTAVRWARILRSLGHRLRIDREYDGKPCDLCIALHARRSYPAVAHYRRLYPAGPLIVALTGTDLYRDIRTNRPAQRSLELADRLIVLQPKGRAELPSRLRSKVRVIYQSAKPTNLARVRNRRFFEACVLGHLRQEKDPFRAALALRRVPEDVPIRILHAGQASSPALAARARRLAAQDPRYRWLGEVPRWRARRILARSQLLILSSRMEGGANVISEALVDGVPVLASRISGSEGMLGDGYPGFFPVGDTGGLARLLVRIAPQGDFYDRLKCWCDHLAPLFEPAREREAWERLLAELRVPFNGDLHHAYQDQTLE
jgi:putative glycosyltransferase (TIGR04348 family)